MLVLIEHRSGGFKVVGVVRLNQKLKAELWRLADSANRTVQEVEILT